MPQIDRTRYDTIRRHLDMLGYQFVFPPDSLLLVEKLTHDVIDLKERLRVCQNNLEKSEEELVNISSALEPYKKDNRRLLSENLELEKKLDNTKERLELEIINLQHEKRVLEDRVDDLLFLQDRVIGKLALQNPQNYEIVKGPKSENFVPENIGEDCNSADRNSVLSKEISQSRVMAGAKDKRGSNITKEMDVLKQDNCKLSDIVVALKRQMKIKDAEIQRMKKALEGGRPIGALRADCCCQCQQKDVIIRNLEQQLQETADKQHEAMARAVQLAERNQLLEKELKDVEKMATSIEEKRDTRQKEFDIMQERLNTAHREIKDLENRVKESREKWETEAKNSEALRKDKRSLEHDLSTAANEKKSLNDKINKLLITEEDLKHEVERLKAANQTLHRRWTEKDSYRDCKETACRAGTCPCKCPSPPRRRPNNPPWTSKRLKDKTEPKICGCAPSLMLLDKLQQERDYYHQECHDLREQLSRTRSCNCVQAADNSRKSAISEESLKFLLDRVEKERDTALTDLRRVQEERDFFKDRMKTPFNSQEEHSRLERILSDVVSSNGVSRGSLSVMERQCEDYRQQLRSCQAELTQVNTLYNQLKNLHEQADRSFSGSQERLMQLERELAHAQNKVRELEKMRWEMEEKLSVSAKEKAAATQNLAIVEKEKDELAATLDDKTERLVRMEEELKRRDIQISECAEQISQAHKKFDIAISEKMTRDHACRTLELTLERVRQDLEQSHREVEMLRAEHRRMQDDLSAALRDGHAAQKEVDLSRQEVANLKRQLQQYVAEVKRAEELISKKEMDQNEMLSNFHTLSLEASTLENNNHTLESEVQISRNMMEDLTRRIQDLETQLCAKDSLVGGCEQQITSLSSQVAELEGRLEMQTQLRSRAEQDNVALRDLCAALDGQKESIRKQASNVDDDKSALSREVRRLSEECNGLSDALSREKSETAALRDSLNHSRQETMKHQMSNKDLTTLIHQLRRSVEELTTRLESESCNVRRYQEQCTDLSSMVTELRREVTNSRYDSSRVSDRTRCLAPVPHSPHSVESDHVICVPGRHVNLDIHFNHRGGNANKQQ